ncbi:unnamed protein product [Heligmosomoides polygyrus]|uniref:Uncharacterized protein n=1 Tax=Heligmosomoides polygyrus TaxID=6339 RepID=A0A183GJ09_HELPZ|nr:unnamed protein product [Heligmosomoides polygyrus]
MVVGLLGEPACGLLARRVSVEMVPRAAKAATIQRVNLDALLERRTIRTYMPTRNDPWWPRLWSARLRMVSGRSIEWTSLKAVEEGVWGVRSCGHEHGGTPTGRRVVAMSDEGKQKAGDRDDVPLVERHCRVVLQTQLSHFLVNARARLVIYPVHLVQVLGGGRLPEALLS